MKDIARTLADSKIWTCSGCGYRIDGIEFLDQLMINAKGNLADGKCPNCKCSDAVLKLRRYGKTTGEIFKNPPGQFETKTKPYWML